MPGRSHAMPFSSAASILPPAASFFAQSNHDQTVYLIGQRRLLSLDGLDKCVPLLIKRNILKSESAIIDEIIQAEVEAGYPSVNHVVALINNKGTQARISLRPGVDETTSAATSGVVIDLKGPAWKWSHSMCKEVNKAGGLITVSKSVFLSNGMQSTKTIKDSKGVLQFLISDTLKLVDVELWTEQRNLLMEKQAKGIDILAEMKEILDERNQPLPSLRKLDDVEDVKAAILKQVEAPGEEIDVDADALEMQRVAAQTEKQGEFIKQLDNISYDDVKEKLYAIIQEKNRKALDTKGHGNIAGSVPAEEERVSMERLAEFLESAAMEKDDVWKKVIGDRGHEDPEGAFRSRNTAIDKESTYADTLNAMLGALQDHVTVRTKREGLTAGGAEHVKAGHAPRLSKAPTKLAHANPFDVLLPDSKKH